MKVPRNLPLEMPAPLGCGLQTGAGTVVNSLALPAGASIAAFGTGGVGLAAVMAARIVGAHPIIGVDRIPPRLNLALELGATHVIDTRRESVTEGIRAATGGSVCPRGKKVDFPSIKSACSDGIHGALPPGRRLLAAIQPD